MKNIGPVSGAWLREIGITSLAELHAIGSVTAFRDIKARHPNKASFNLLWALEGAIQARNCRDFSPEEKDHLKGQLRGLGEAVK